MNFENFKIDFLIMNFENFKIDFLIMNFEFNSDR